MNSGLGEVSCKKSKAWFLEEFLSDMPGSDITPVVASLLREQLPCSNWKQGWWNFFIQRSEPHGNQGSENPPHPSKREITSDSSSVHFPAKIPPDFHVFTLEMGAHFPTDPTLRTDPAWDLELLNWTAWKFFWHFPSWKTRQVKASLTEVQHLVATSRAFCAVKAGP